MYFKLGVRCPECNMFIKKFDDVKDMPSEPFVCYSCEKQITVSSHDVVVLESATLRDEKRDLWNALHEIFNLLEEYEPQWYTRGHYNKIKKALEV